MQRRSSRKRGLDRSSRSDLLELIVKQDLECLEERFINDEIGVYNVHVLL